ncbi:MAG: biotin--[acetyl-CoA-carboxylase] ligase [Cyclobacteriaceae bacterium]
MLRISFNTHCIGREFLHLRECDSTNALVMRQLASQDAAEGLLVLADFQTAGRGQRDARWEAQPGLNLTFTLALFPQIPVEKQFYLNIMAALAITDTLNQLPDDVLRIKWPNDIYYHDSKICGILLQNNLRSNKIHSCALGIGLNVNQLHFEEGRASSLKKITGRTYDRIQLLQQLAEQLENRYYQLKSGEYGRLKRLYLQRLYRMDEWHTFRAAGKQFEGRIVGINEEGQLAVERNAGLQFFNYKEITYCY